MRNNSVAVSRVMQACEGLLAITALGHVFCCGLPLVLGIVSIISTTTSYSLESLPILHMFREYEEFALLFATVVIIVSAILQWVSDRLDCHSTGCGHGPCTPKKQRSKHVFRLSLGLYILSMSLHFIAH